MDTKELIEVVFLSGTAISLLCFTALIIVMLRANKFKRHTEEHKELYKESLKNEFLVLFSSRSNVTNKRKHFINEYIESLVNIINMVDKDAIAEKDGYQKWLDTIRKIYERINEEELELTEANWAELHGPETPLDIIILGYYELYRKRNFGAIDLDVSTSLKNVHPLAVYPLLRLIQVFCNSTKLHTVKIRTALDSIIIHIPDTVSEKEIKEVQQLAIVYNGKFFENRVIFKSNPNNLATPLL